MFRCVRTNESGSLARKLDGGKSVVDAYDRETVVNRLGRATPWLCCKITGASRWRAGCRGHLARFFRLCRVLTWWVAPGVFGGTEYDLTEACRNCRAGAKQSSILYLSDPDQKTLKKTAATGSSENEIVVDDGLRQELINAGGNGNIVWGSSSAAIKKRNGLRRSIIKS